MKNYLYILFLFGFIISCRNDENTVQTTEEEIMPEKVDFSFVKEAGFFTNSPDRNYTFQYDNNKRLIGVIGGIIYLPNTSGGVPSIFSTSVGSKITYSNNIATLTNYSIYSNYTNEGGKITYTLDGSKIIEKYIPSNDINDKWNNKKMFFKYNNSKISEILTTFPDRPYNANDPNDIKLSLSEKFEYNSSGNLLKITKFTLYNDVIIGTTSITEFSNYDNAKNPFKKLGLLDDFFYRSLSTNNYRKITQINYDIFGTQTSSSYYTWGFSYDTSGNLILTK